MTLSKVTIVGVVVAIVIALLSIGISLSAGKAPSFGGVSNYDQMGVQQLKIGTTCNNGNLYSSCNGTAVNGLNTGTCYLDPYAATIAATSTVTVDCQGTAAADASGSSALTGVTLGDAVSVQLSTTTSGTLSGGLHIAGASASSTTGHIQLNVTNLTGATYTWPTSGNASGTASYIVTR